MNVGGNVSSNVRGGESPAVDPIVGLIAEAKGWYDTTPTTLKTDLVASFDSTDWLSSINTAFLPATGDFSVSMWVKHAADTTQRAAVSVWNPTGNERGWAIYKSAADVWVFEVSDDGTASNVATSTVSADDTWQYVVAWKSGDTINISVNGETPVSAAHTGGVNASAADLALSSFDGASAFYNGGLAHVAYWDEALDGTERSDLYNSGTIRLIPDTVATTNRVAYWPLWEPRGVRYDSWAANNLADNNTVGAVTGPVEYQAAENAGITKWENQGGAASPFGDLVEVFGTGTVPTLSGDRLLNSAVSKGLQTGTGSLAQILTIVCRFEQNVAEVNARPFAGSTNSVVTLYTAGGKFTQYAGANVSGSTSNLLPHTAVLEYNGPSSSFWLDDMVTAVATGNSGANSIIGLTLGGYSGNFTMKGYIGAIAVFSRALTEPERLAIAAFFA